MQDLPRRVVLSRHSENFLRLGQRPIIFLLNQDRRRRRRASSRTLRERKKEDKLAATCRLPVAARAQVEKCFQRRHRSVCVVRLLYAAEYHEAATRLSPLSRR